jgi:hypothetical protein
MNFQPRFVRQKDAPGYLGVNKNYFNAYFRPELTEIRLGPQMLMYDRLELDALAEHIKTLHGRPAEQKGERESWRNKKSPVSPSGMGRTTSTKSSEEKEFAKALEQATSKKRNAT